MVLPFFTGFNQFRHAVSCNGSIFKLISAGTNRHVISFNTGRVVDRKPIIRDIIKIDHSSFPRRFFQGRNSPHAPVNLGFPLAVGDLTVEFIRIRDPLLGITLRVLTSDQNAVSRFRTEVDGIVPVRGMNAVFFKIKSGRRGHMVNFMSQGFGFDVHVIFDPGHLIDNEGVRTGHIDQHFTVNLFPGFQRHPLDLSV